jgi:alanyl-tRNA synthetase
LRELFVKFFEERGHTFVPSDSLVPKNDPTLLFTNAGMNQFKDIFLGKGERDYTRAVNYQKCMRVSGKHNDLEEVGRDTYHHTFFEMLGNWSFGDYYKEEAIKWSWEFVVDVLKIPRDKLWITVHYTDDESMEIWKKVSGFGEDRILKFGDKENFWEMGDTGPCGPCTEIHFDRGEQYKCGPDCKVNCECGRFIELWNNVFMQYYRNENGELEPLKNKHVDTGMGLERTLAVMNHLDSNYDTDLFQPIIGKTASLSGKKYGENEEDDVAFRVIADHIRALVFTITDGIIFSNEGQGYVIRKILRRAERFGRELGFKAPFLYKLVEVVVQIMAEAYPELTSKQTYVENMIRQEEEKFIKTLDSGLEMLNRYLKELKEKKEKVLSGEAAFVLYDTYGFPLEATKDVCLKEGFEVDEKNFHAEMEKQKERAREAHQKKLGGATIEKELDALLKQGIQTEYVGEELTEITAHLIAKISSEYLVFDRTPFYGESGGQVGDIGWIYDSMGKKIAEVLDTYRYEGKIFYHKINKKDFSHFEIGKEYKLKIAAERRKAIRRHHTATHLLQAALRKVIGEHITQAGSRVSEMSLRFDFTHHSHLTEKELRRIEEEVNTLIVENLQVQIKIMALQEAKKMGAMALFNEKYGDTVRVIDIEGKSIELCGGSHVKRTGDIGFFKVLVESAVGSGVRRIEAVCGLRALTEVQKRWKILDELSLTMTSPWMKLPEKAEKILEEQKELKKKIKKLESGQSGNKLQELEKEIKPISDFKILAHIFTDANFKNLLPFSDQLLQKYNNLALLFVNLDKEKGKVQLLVRVGSALSGRFHAGKLVGRLAKEVGGGGGGRPDMAQAGGKNVEKASKLPELFQTLLTENEAEIG